MSNSSTFRAWLKRRRQERGLTQEGLGEAVNYAGQTIAKIESGQRRPSPQLALRLAEALQIAPEEHPAWMAAALAGADSEASTPETFAPEAFSTEVKPLHRPKPLAGMPVFLTPFLGREQEQAELAALLGRPDCRLITLLGPGGVGKTRLAIETGRTAQGFPDGTAFVSLASVATPASIVPAIGDALGFNFSDTSDLLAQLLSHMHDQRILLVLDNLEQLIDPAGVTLGLLEQLLAHAPDISVLATSRERLRLAGEWVLELGGLAVPQPDARMQPQTAPAIRLFVEHAERVDRAFRLTTENQITIATICRLVDGLPLGIELAAAWLRLLSLDEIVQELTRGLDTLHLSSRTLPARHQSLRAVVDHSWQLLSGAERSALRQLSVFRGGFTREAAAQVAAANLHLLANLVDKSLLRRGANGRYDLHEIIRQFADLQLQEQADEFATTCGRHATYYLRFLSEREHQLMGAEQMAAMAEISAEIDNIRAAWMWATTHAQLTELKRAAKVLQWFYAFRRWFEEGVALFAHAVEQVRSIGASDDEFWRQTLGRLLGHYGYLAARSGAFMQAKAALTESYTLLADGRDPVGLAVVLLYQGMAAYWVGNYGEARHILDRSLILARATGDRSIQGASLIWANNIAHAEGAYEEAEQHFRAALAIYREMKNARDIIWCITYCSGTLLALGKYEEAERLLHESLTLSHATNDRYGMASSLHNLGRTALRQQHVDEAIYFFREALPLLRTSGSYVYAQAFNDLAAVLWQAGAKAEAGRAYRDALAAALEIGAIPEALQAMSGLATHLADAGDQAAALGLAARVLADTAGRDEARHRAAEVQQAARTHLAVDEATRIEQRASTRTLAEFLADHSSPGL